MGGGLFLSFSLETGTRCVMADTVAESISVTRSPGKLRLCCSTRDTCTSSFTSMSGEDEEADEDDVFVLIANLLRARTLWLSVCLPLLLRILTGSIFTIVHKIFTLLYLIMVSSLHFTRYDLFEVRGIVQHNNNCNVLTSKG